MRNFIDSSRTANRAPAIFAMSVAVAATIGRSFPFLRIWNQGGVRDDVLPKLPNRFRLQLRPYVIGQHIDSVVRLDEAPNTHFVAGLREISREDRAIDGLFLGDQNLRI